MERRNENDPISAIQGRIIRQKLKINQTNQERDNILPDTFGLEENNNKQEIINMNIHLRD